MNNKNPKEIKRERIISAAEQIFAQKGYHNSTMGEIAIAAGIGKGTIYEYFDSKLSLFLDMMENGLRRYYESLDVDIVQKKSFEERLRFLLEEHIKFCQENEELARIVFWDTQVLDEELKDWVYQRRRDKDRRLEQLIEDGIQRGEIREIDSALLAIMLGGSITSTWVPVVLEGWDVDAAKMADQIVDTIMNGIKKS